MDQGNILGILISIILYIYGLGLIDKLCIFLQSMLRGRGGCYKHTFYGIESHRCMESTPSLACANKCVFCWRFVGSTFLNILEKV
jgi:hypothetical protein